jgi:hypothetical protein
VTDELPPRPARRVHGRPLRGQRPDAARMSYETDVNEERLLITCLPLPADENAHHSSRDDNL